MHSSPGAGAPEAFRPDIEGLRGIAVLLVVLFHAGLVGLPGGFIGVDVFFVISGFLITGLLLRERETAGTIRLGPFYARRVRRLLPAGLTALAVTLVASLAMLNPLDHAGAALDAAAAALSIANIRFALAAGDYFASVESPSPLLHFWSLAVEEQFYLVWPALILLAARGLRPRAGAALALGLVVAASLAANLVVTNVAPGWAFYSLPTRAWQLAAGGLLVVAAPARRRIPAVILAAMGWAGLLVLGSAAIVLDSGLAYPGAWAIVPTLAAASLIVAGRAVRGPGMLLGIRPLRFLGRISYSLYLWHWPILVLPAALVGAELPIAGRAALVGLAVLVAWGSWRFIEEPFRVGLPSLAQHPMRTILAGGVAVALVVSSAGGLAAAEQAGLETSASVSSRLIDDRGGTTGDGLPPDDPAPTAATRGGSGAFGLPWAEPTDRPDDTVAGWPTEPPASVSPTALPTAPPTPQTYVRLPADVRPSLAGARTDRERLWSDGCLAVEGATTPRSCVYGDREGDVTVALVGDSHASHWFPALEAVASSRGWRLLAYVKVSCPFVDIRVTNLELKREYRECAAFNEATLARLNEARPDLTLVSMSRFAIHPVLSRDATVAAQAASLARMLDRIPGRVAVIVDTPDGGRDIPACLAAHTADVRVCAISQSVALARDLGAIERGATEATGDGLIDLTSAVCSSYPCPVVVDGMIVFRDVRHLTATFAGSLAGRLAEALIGLLPRP